MFDINRNGRELGLLFGKKWEWDCSQTFSKAGNGIMSWKWEENRTQISFPYISTLEACGG